MSHGTLPTIPDAGDRRLAETTFDRNVVVVAGAGTGKTTLLVNRLIHTLMREPSPVEITRLVALTFTNKAATEMKGRLRDRLLLLQDATGEAGDTTGLGAELLAELRARYGLSADKIGERARAALHDLEKAQIGTLHSFAAHILRLYPIESGVDPDFREDDGLRFEEHFTTQWDVWLDAELGRSGHNHARWRRVLARIGLGSIRDLAQALTSELIDLEDLRRHLDDPHVPAGLRTWFQDKRERAAALLAAHDRPKRRSVEKILAAAQDLFAILAEPGPGGDGRIRLDAAIREDLARKLGSPPAGWADDEFAEAGALARLARQSVDVDHGFLGEVLALVVPFVAGVRTAFLQEGWMTFDGLLARARLLLRDHPGVRERLKHEYQALLVDEFQDTDPVQYEIILYLAERAGRGERSWQGLDLAPGKLFIVGDPKQSIYAFRRADIEAFERVVAKIQESGGVQFTLTANFRSHPAVLSVVNPVFDRLLRPVAHVQPRNVPLVPLPDRRGGAATPGVELHLVSSADEEAFDASTATRCEAEQLARWIKEDLLGRETLTDAGGQPMPLRPGHIALLFRKLTIAQEYLDALRRNNVPYVTDGEKHFYRRQEVVDLINVLRVVDNPHDTIALVGVLRSPLGGLNDQELLALRELDALDYRRADRLATWESPRRVALTDLYHRLRDLAPDVQRRPLPDAVSLILSRLPVLELAAGSLHGEQAVANLLKIRQLAAELADRPDLTLAGFVDRLVARVSEQRDEAESSLAEETLDAVRVLTIHKAKGLEFPVVVLPGLHQESGGGGAWSVGQDWSTGVTGVRIGEWCNVGALVVGDKMRVREEAEWKRLFYVGWTRARDRLILSGGVTARSSRDSFLALLRAVAGDGVGAADSPALRIGEAELTQRVSRMAESRPRGMERRPKTLAPAREVPGLVARWEERDRRWAQALATRSVLSPTRLMAEAGRVPPGTTRPTHDGQAARRLGTLVHRALEGWDFRRDPGELAAYAKMIGRLVLAEADGLESGDGDRLLEELESLLITFRETAPYAELQRADILGREVPFAFPWILPDTRSSALSLPAARPPEASGGRAGLRQAGQQSSTAVMEGVLDVLYRLDGRLWVADFKTDRVEAGGLQDLLARYRVQAGIYREAVARALGCGDVGFKFIFVRTGEAQVLD